MPLQLAVELHYSAYNGGINTFDTPTQMAILFMHLSNLVRVAQLVILLCMIENLMPTSHDFAHGVSHSEMHLVLSPHPCV